MTTFETLLGRTLGLGVGLSTLLLGLGLGLSLAQAGHAADVLMHAGLIVLMATPVARVLISCVEFIRQRDWFFAANAFGVLVVLAVTVWSATR